MLLEFCFVCLPWSRPFVLSWIMHTKLALVLNRKGGVDWALYIEYNNNIALLSSNDNSILKIAQANGLSCGPRCEGIVGLLWPFTFYLASKAGWRWRRSLKFCFWGCLSTSTKRFCWSFISFNQSIRIDMRQCQYFWFRVNACLKIFLVCCRTNGLVRSNILGGLFRSRFFPLCRPLTFVRENYCSSVKAKMTLDEIQAKVLHHCNHILQ